MRKSVPIQLSIPSPCSENWDQMTPDAQGRFCAHCQKSVIDFTTWSDTMLYEFFTKNNGKTCGRFRADQLNRTINIPSQPNSKLYRVAIALGLTILISQAQETRARVMPPLMEQNILAPVDDSTCSDTVLIKGQVLDEKKEPMIGVVVQLEKEDGTVIGGVPTDIDGYFNIQLMQNLKVSLVQLRISYVGYEQKLIRLSIDSKLEIAPIALKPDNRCKPTTGEIVIKRIEYRPPLIDTKKSGPNKTVTIKDLRNMGY